MTSSRVTRMTLLGTFMVLASIVATAQGRGGRGVAAPAQAPSDPDDLSGFWELPPDGPNVPRASLAPGITQRILD